MWQDFCVYKGFATPFEGWLRHIKMGNVCIWLIQIKVVLGEPLLYNTSSI